MRRLLAGMLLAATMAACGDTTTGVRSTSGHTGTYTLRTVNDQALPATVGTENNVRLDIVSGSVILLANGSFRDSTEYRLVSGSTSVTESDVFAGTYTRNGGVVQFTVDSGGAYTMSFTGGTTLTQTLEGVVLVYRK